MTVLFLVALMTLVDTTGPHVQARFREGIEERLVTIEGGPVSVRVRGGERDDVVAQLELPDGYVAPRPMLGIQARLDRIAVHVVGVHSPDVVLLVEVPARTDLRLRTSNAGPAIIERVTGELDVFCSNTGVELIDVGGSATVATSNGPIVARFTGPVANRPMSFITSNGVIDLTLPRSFRGRVHMETDNGELTSDFDIRVDGGPARDRVEEWGGRLKMIREGWIGDGGSTLRLRTDNDSIHLRALDEASARR